MFKTVDENGNFEVTNRALNEFDEVFEAIIYLLRVRSPFVKDDFSLDEFIGNIDIESIQHELEIVLGHVYETILMNYDVINIQTLDISIEEDGFIRIEILLQTPTATVTRAIYA